MRDPIDWAEIERQCRAILPARGVVAARQELLAYDCDGLTLNRHQPPLVVLPETTEQVSALVRLCHQQGVPFVARGSGTGLSGGAVAETAALVIATSRMRSILDLDLANRRITVQPGVINSWVTRAVCGEGYYYAPDPSSQVVCSIGGNVAENSGGVHCLKYGVTSNHVLELEVVLPDGSVTRLGSGLAETPELDLRGVFIGSEGTLGIATAITLRLLRTPQSVAVMLADFAAMESAGEAVRTVTAAGVLPAGMEIMDNFTINAVNDLFGFDEYPRDAAAVLLIELDGQAGEVAAALDLAESRWPDHTHLLRPRWRRAPQCPAAGIGGHRSPRPPVRPARGQCLPCRRWQPPSPDSLSSRRARCRPARPGVGGRHPAALHRRWRQHHGRAWGRQRQALLPRLDVRAR